VHLPENNTFEQKDSSEHVFPSGLLRAQGIQHPTFGTTDPQELRKYKTFIKVTVPSSMKILAKLPSLCHMLHRFAR
jgi:hypothetical protein